MPFKYHYKMGIMFYLILKTVHLSSLEIQFSKWFHRTDIITVIT